tara:strand:- start:125 stop:1234 length:1110 start_codon:yes stop_codon:yes gene_type:complete
MEENFISKMNTDFIFDKISDILMSNHSINIKLNDKYKKLYEDNIKYIYDNYINEVSSLEGLNDLLLKESVSLLSDKIKNIEEENNKKMSGNINDLMKQYNKDNENLLKNIPLNNENLLKNNSLNNNNPLNNKVPEQNNNLFNNPNEFNNIENKTIYQNDKKPKNNNIIKISSMNRLNNNSSRYNYKIDLKYNNIKFNNNKLDKVLLPIEDNYIFSSPIIYIKINENNIMLKLEELIENNGRKYGVYYPIDNNIKFNCNNNININITDLSETIHTIIDILNVNKIIINDEFIILYNKYIIKEYLKNDYIKLIDYEKNIIDMNSILTQPLKIHDINENKLIIKKNNNVKKISLDIDMKFINLSNQNFIFFK